MNILFRLALILIMLSTSDLFTQWVTVSIGGSRSFNSINSPQANYVYAVSYTHLDVYKRQHIHMANTAIRRKLQGAWQIMDAWMWGIARNLAKPWSTDIHPSVCMYHDHVSFHTQP